MARDQQQAIRHTTFPPSHLRTRSSQKKKKPYRCNIVALNHSSIRLLEVFCFASPSPVNNRQDTRINNCFIELLVSSSSRSSIVHFAWLAKVTSLICSRWFMSRRDATGRQQGADSYSSYYCNTMASFHIWTLDNRSCQWDFPH